MNVEAKRLASNMWSAAVDRLGIVLSSLCAAHCVLTSVLIVVIPSFGHYFGDEVFHVAMAGILTPLSLWTFLRGYFQHKNALVVLFGFPGLTLILAALVAPEYPALPGFSLEELMTTGGGVLLVSGHLVNLHHHRH